MTYFGDDPALNEMHARIEALLRAIPEESMRVQFRYEVVENTNGLIDRYEALQRTESEIARRMDTIRMEGWRKEEEDGAFLTRLAAVYFIWDPALHERLNRTAAGALRACSTPEARSHHRLSGQALQQRPSPRRPHGYGCSSSTRL